MDAIRASVTFIYSIINRLFQFCEDLDASLVEINNEEEHIALSALREAEIGTNGGAHLGADSYAGPSITDFVWHQSARQVAAASAFTCWGANEPHNAAE